MLLELKPTKLLLTQCHIYICIAWKLLQDTTFINYTRTVGTCQYVFCLLTQTAHSQISALLYPGKLPSEENLCATYTLIPSICQDMAYSIKLRTIYTLSCCPFSTHHIFNQKLEEYQILRNIHVVSCIKRIVFNIRLNAFTLNTSYSQLTNCEFALQILNVLINY